MAKYRKKPVTIDAVLWTGKNHREMFDFLTNDMFHNAPMTSCGKNFDINHKKVEGGLVIKTLEGEHIATLPKKTSLTQVYGSGRVFITIKQMNGKREADRKL